MVFGPVAAVGPGWDDRVAVLLPGLRKAWLRLLEATPASARPALARAWLRSHPLPRDIEAELVDEVSRCWDGVPLPGALTDLVDDARLDALLNLAEARAIACDGPARTGAHLQIESLIPLEQARRGDRAALVLSASYGRWQALAPALARRGYRVGLLDLRPQHRRAAVPPPAAPGLDLRRLPWKGYARDLVRFAAQPGAVIVALADAGNGPRWATGALFGRPAQVGSTPFELAVRCGLTALPAFVVREHGRTSLHFEKPLRLSRGGSDHDLDVNASKWLKLVERNVRRHPSHYLGHLLLRRLQRQQDPVPFFAD